MHIERLSPWRDEVEAVLSWLRPADQDSELGQGVAVPGNTLYYGDNLDVLRRHVADESVDLVYLDPPFKSDQDYNVLFAEQDGSRSQAQIKAFGDTWRWDQASAAAYEEVVESGPERVAKAMQAFRTFLGESDMLAYLSMMAPRLVELRRVLKPGGSIYLHCDPTASHYLKMLMDGVFGQKGFRSEIIWSYRRWPTKTANYQHMHDVLLYYTKSERPTFNVLYEAVSDSFLKRFKGKGNVLDPGATKKRPSATDTPGLPVRDVWEISIIAGSATERLGYPTQKPEALLERIISVSSNEGALVLDPFCGCGTAIAVAQKLNRNWIGIDITHLAITLIKHRLKDAFGKKAVYKVVGEPVSLPDAQALAEQDPYQFQWWALGLVGARPAEQKKGADRGVDGRIYFHDEPEARAKTKQITLQVKAGHVTANQMRDLRGVVEREKAEIGALICMEAPTQPMRKEAASAGFYESPWGKHPRLQILTVEELLAGKGIDYPPSQQANRTFKRAPKAKARAAKPDRLPEL